MKSRILDRILVALAGVLMLLGGVALAAQLFFGKDVAGRVSQWMADDTARVYLIIAAILICALGVYCVMLLFRNSGRNGKFIMQKTDSGELAISLKALETMVQKCLEQHKELNAQSVTLGNQKGSLLVRIRGTVAGGISIPLTVETLQQQIKQYVTACSGVEVRDIRVEIESSGPDAKDAPFAIEAPVAKGLLKAAGETTAEETEQKPAEKTETAAPEQQPTAETAETETPAPAPEKTQTPDELSAAAAAAAMLMNQVPEEEDDRPMHQRLFSTVEEPCVMPMPPVNLGEEGKAENEAEAAGPAEEKKPAETKPEETETEEAKPTELKTEEPKAEEPKAGDLRTEEIKPEEGKINQKIPEETTFDGMIPEEKEPAEETKETPEIKAAEGGVED